MKITIYCGNTKPESPAIAALLEAVPETTATITIQAPIRRPIDLRACQRPGHLEYVANCDDKVFLHLTQVSPTSPFNIKVM